MMMKKTALFSVFFLLSASMGWGFEDFLVVSDRSPDPQPGLVFLEPNRGTVIVIPEQCGAPVKYAAELIQQAIEQSTGYQAKILNDEEALSHGFLEHSIELVRVGRFAPARDVRDTFTIQASRDWGRNILRISSPTERGLLRGAAEMLRYTMNAEWFPPRTHHCFFWKYNHVPQDPRMKIMTYLERRERLVWPDAINPLTHSDLFADQGFLIDRYQISRSVVDWCVLQGINLLAVYLECSPDRDALFVPLEGKEIARLREIIDYAHQLGIRVVGFDFPFVCAPSDLDKHPEITGQSLDEKGKRVGKELYRPDLEITRTCSTQYFNRLTEQLDTDGLFFHPSSEVVRKIPVPEGKPAYYWDVTYMQDYFSQFLKQRPDGIAAVVAGWEFMENPNELKPCFSENVVLCIVPGKEETEAHFLEYQALFPCWHWLYPFYSSQGIHPALSNRAEYPGLCRRINDALVVGARGVLPESYIIRGHEAPLLYLMSLYRNPDLDFDTFTRDFCTQFFNGVTRAALGWEAYWNTQYEAAFQYFRESYAKASEPIIRDHLRDMAFSALYLDLDAKIVSLPGDTIENKLKFLNAQKTAITDAFQSIPDPLSSEEDEDLWLPIMHVLEQKIDKKIADTNSGK